MKSIILLSGKLQSGKNTFADFLAEELKANEQQVVTDMLAADLKALSYQACKPLISVLKNIRSKLIQIADPKWLTIHGYPLLDKLTLKEENFYEEKTEISRVLLQIIGTDIGRTLAGDTVWVDKFIKRTNEEEFDVKLVTDVRFPNELEMLKALDSEDCRVVSIRVEREIDRSTSENEHESETALDGYKNWDYIIDNNGTVGELKASAEVLVAALLNGEL
jgi:dephospho-CoA kinase